MHGLPAVLIFSSQKHTVLLRQPLNHLEVSVCAHVVYGVPTLDTQGLVVSALLDTMRSQCHWLLMELGQTVWAEQAVFHVCMVLQDTMEGCLTAFVVLSMY